MGIEEVFIAIIGGFVGGTMSLILYYYNLKKEAFFRLQEKGELLLTSLFEYQGNLCEIDLQKSNLADITVVNKEELKDFDSKYEIHKEFTLKHQKIRDIIRSLITIYFPSIEQSFREYTNIEVTHYMATKDTFEITNHRESKISEIAKQIIDLINKKRKVFLRFKI